MKRHCLNSCVGCQYPLCVYLQNIFGRCCVGAAADDWIGSSSWVRAWASIDQGGIWPGLGRFSAWLIGLGQSLGAAAVKPMGSSSGPAGASGLHCFAGFAMFGSFLFCTYKNTMPQKLTRAQIKAGLEQVPIESLLSSGEGKTPKLTSKQKAFAHAVALGETKANAYRKAYKQTATKRTLACKPYELMRDERIQREAEAYRLALAAAEHRTPAQLKALLVQQLVQHSIDEDFPPAQRLKALQLIGQLFEVGAFLERKETTVVHKSADIRSRLLERLQLRTPAGDKASDALELLTEIQGGSTSEAASADPTPPGGRQTGPAAVGALSHTIPHTQSPTKNDGGPMQKSPDQVLDFDKE